MGGLVLEILSRGRLSEFRRLDHFPVRIGRALDNDIILSDPTVSPHHLTIGRDEQACITLEGDTQENGVQLDGKRLAAGVHPVRPPASLELGRVRLRLLAPQATVAPTHRVGCGERCMLHSLPAVLALGAALLTYFGWQKVLGASQAVRVEDLLATLGLVAFGILFSAGVLSGFLRMTVQRWEFATAIGLTALFGLGSAGVQMTGPALNYFLTAQWPNHVLESAWLIVLTPLLLVWALRRVSHVPRPAAIVLALLLVSPLAYVQATQLLKAYPRAGDFSPRAVYNNELSPWDIRLRKTLSIEAFVQRMQAPPGPTKDFPSP